MCNTFCNIATKKIKIGNGIIDLIICVIYHYDNI